MLRRGLDVLKLSSIYSANELCLKVREVVLALTFRHETIIGIVCNVEILCCFWWCLDPLLKTVI